MPTISQEYRKSDLEFLISENENKPVDRPPEKISLWIAERRILPLGSPFPGLWSNSVTPYNVEIMDNMAVSSSIQHQSIMKAAQVGLTAAAENIIAFYMAACPAEQLFITATEPLLKKWANKRLDPLIESCGIKIGSQTERTGSKKTGDTAYSKEYAGGCLDLASAQSPPSLRSDAKRVVVRDEIDAAPEYLVTGEGKWLHVSAARTKTFGHRKKIMDLSTPQVDGISPIQKQYDLGDQRKFMVPCPIPGCGKYQELVWGYDISQHGLQFETKAGKFSECYYICEFCHDAFRNSAKKKILGQGYWEPTSQSFSPVYRSYQISSLYAPIGMYSWQECCEEYLSLQDEPDGMRSFTNLTLGLPYKEIGTRPNVEYVMELKSGYHENTVPDGPLFLTMAVDVQRGTDKDPNYPPRLELEVCGHGSLYRTWSITYRQIIGAIDDPSAGAWAELEELQMSGGLIFERSDGLKFGPLTIFIDSGYKTDVVYQFCQAWQNTFPCKGVNILKKNQKETGDDVNQMNFTKYRATKVGEDITLYTMSTNYYKTHIYNNLKKVRNEMGPQRSGFCEFPQEYTRKYFDMLTAEEQRKDKSFHQGTRHNESLDLRVYNLAACDAYLDARVKEFKTIVRKKGGNQIEVDSVTHKTVLTWLFNSTKRLKQEKSE